MDKIIINDLQIYAYHGVNLKEKEQGQMFIMSLIIYLDLSNAAEKDDLSLTIDYSSLCQDVEKVFKRKKYALIEAAAMDVIKMIISKYRIANEVEILLKKPDAPLEQKLDYVAVNIKRSRSEINE